MASPSSTISGTNSTFVLPVSDRESGLLSARRGSLSFPSMEPRLLLWPESSVVCFKTEGRGEDEKSAVPFVVSWVCGTSGVRSLSIAIAGNFENDVFFLEMHHFDRFNRMQIIFYTLYVLADRLFGRDCARIIDAFWLRDGS